MFVQVTVVLRVTNGDGVKEVHIRRSIVRNRVQLHVAESFDCSKPEWKVTSQV